MRSRVRSPNRRQAITDQLNEHTHRIKELMQEDITFLEEENAKLKVQCLKAEEMQQKIEIIIQHNEELTQENIKLQRFLEEKLEQISALKFRGGDSRAWDLERKKLHKEIDYLRQSVQEVESMKSLTIQEIKAKHKIEMDQVMQENEKGIALFEKELKKMKERLDKTGETEKELQSKLLKKQENIIKLHGQIEEKSNEIKNTHKPAIKKLEEELKKKEAIMSQTQIQAKKLESQIKKLQGQIIELKAEKAVLQDKLNSGSQSESELREEIERLTKVWEGSKEQLEKERKSSEKSQEKLEGDISKLKNQRKELKQEISEKLFEIEEANRNIRRLNDSIKDRDEDLETKSQSIARLEDITRKQDGQLGQLQNKIREFQDQINRQQLKLNEQIEQLRISKKKNEDLVYRNEELSLNLIKAQEELKVKSTLIQELEANKSKALLDNSVLKEKMEELAVLNSGEVRDLKNKLEEIYEQEIRQIKLEAERVQTMMGEDIIKLQDQSAFKDIRINKLEQQLSVKQRQIVILNEDQAELKQKFLLEGKNMKDDLTSLHLEYQEMEMKNYDKIKKLETELRNVTVENSKRIEEITFKAAQTLEEKRINDQLREEIAQLQIRFDQRVSRLEAEARNWKEKYDEIKMIKEKNKEEADAEKESLISTYKQKQYYAEDQMRMWKERFTKLESENESLKEFIRRRDKTINELEEKLPSLHKQLEEREEAIDELRNKIVENQRKIKKKYDQKRESIETNFDLRLNEQQQIYESKFLMMSHELEKAHKKIIDRENETKEILRQYQRLRDEMQKISNQGAEQKEYSLKFPGATAELIASKNMFDVFIKTKVLEYCGDAMGEQNKENRGM